MTLDSVSPAALLSFHATFPQGKRIFAPLLARFLLFCGFAPLQAFFAVETIAAAAFVLGLRRLFVRFASPRAAATAALAALAILPPVFSLQAFQPWDTWIMAFLAWALVFIVESRFRSLLLLMPCASLNHETAVLIPLLFLAVHAGRLPLLRPFRSLLSVSLALFVLHVTVLGLVTLWAAPRIPVSGYPPENMWCGMVLRHLDDNGTFVFNWVYSFRWLAGSPLRWAVVLFSMSALPVFFFLFWREHVPEARRCALVALFHLASVFVTGIVLEVRCFAATVAILYPLVALAAFRALDPNHVGDLSLPAIPRIVQRRLAVLEILALVFLPFALFAFMSIAPRLLPPPPPALLPLLPAGP